MKNDLQRLRAIIEASKRLTAVLDLDELLNVILDVALTELEAERGTVFLADRERKQIYSRILRGDEISEIRLPIGAGVAGYVIESGETVIIDDPYSDSRFNPETDRATGFHTRSILCAPLMQGEEVIGGLQLLNHKRGRFTTDDAEYLSALAAHVVIALENARAHLERLEQERTRKELELAARIQQNLLPERPPELPGLSLGVVYQPCRAVGGDLYDFFTLPRDRFGVLLADVSGKGAPAALITAALHAYLHALIEDYRDPEHLCRRLNGLLHRTTPPSSYATMLFLEYDLADRRLRYCNCGHLPMMFLRSGECELLTPTGTVIGLLPAGEYRIEEKIVQDGDLLLLFTDGLTEASANGTDEEEMTEEFGLERVRTVCKANAGGPEQALDGLLREVNAFSNGAPRADDLTMLALRFGRGGLI